MVVERQTEIVFDHKFDRKRCRHILNGKVHVLHCHHYATLYSRLADDCGMLDGKKLLAEVAEDTFTDLLSGYFKEHCIKNIADRIAIAEQYYAATGLGQMKVLCAGYESGEVELLHSHLDEGWIKKWEKKENPVNFMTCGYIAAMFNAVFELPRRSFRVKEMEGIVTGAERSKFNVVAN